MRRLEDGHAQRPPPFRVLAATDAPPARAPEPYKITASTSSLSRAHRRSSFVIIAESRPTTPASRSPSPTLGAGRASPFRGRGFKGPPPRARSRPQSPEDGRKRGRNDRRASVSQQNSPRRSLIPQPTRQRSTSLSKANDRTSSPKIGRRVDSRNRLNVSESRSRLNASSSITNLSTRRQLTKSSSRLSPIQGTPTKPEKVVPQYARRDRFNDTTRSSPTKTGRSSVHSQSKNALNKPRRPNQEKNSGRERLNSPSKIPLKTSRNGTVSLNPARFITIPDQPAENASKKNDKESKAASCEEEQGRVPSKGTNRSEANSKESRSNEKNSSSSEKSKELDLINLLKQSSGATGTSSVVNTTATTAVQPLHIDANAVLVEKDGPEKRKAPDQSKSGPDTSNTKTSNVPTSLEDASARRVQNGHSVGEDQQQRSSGNAQASSKSSKSSSNHNRPRPTDSRNDSPVPVGSVGGHSKHSSIGQSAKNFGKANGTTNGTANGTTNGTGSATQRPNKVQSTGQVYDQNSKSVRTVEQRPADDHSASGQPASSASMSRSNETGSTNAVSGNASSTTTNGEKAVGSASTKTVDVKAASRGNNGTDAKTASTMSSSATTTTTANSTVTNQVTNSVPVNAAVGAVNSSQSVNSAGVRVRNNRDSNASLKSSTGVSMDSIESVRSTDTGVSVNTVRGVSSPREKTGVHVVKRPQEIETLSGNVMHLEQNGEPAVLEANTVDGAVPERFFGRCRRSFGRYCKCWPSMRCLACRTDPKGFPWPRSQSKVTTTTDVTTGQPPTDSTTDSPGCWPRFKNRCRCNRPREMKCCSRRSRIAPAEGAACCPPERRFGAVCRRLFDRCKCKSNEAERTRSIRAKHSLTSVGPPPLSEEPKCKIPDVLVEHNSLMRGAIPCLPVPLAWFCLVWNILLPGSGTVWSGIFNLCTGQPRFSPVASLKSRLGAFVVNLVVGVGQLFTVLFCLVGWGWSIWWGVTLIRLARKYRRFKASEAANNDPEARGGDPAALPPGVPSQALRGMERAR